MAMNTPNWQKQYNATTTALAAQTAQDAVLVIDTTKHTAVVMDGTTAGGHPLAKEAVKIKSGSPNVKINGATEGNLGGDITINVLPGVVPGNMTLVQNPDDDHVGQFLQVTYTKADGTEGKYFIDVNDLVDEYTAGKGITITGNEISVNAAGLVQDVAKPGAGLGTDTDGKLVIKPAEIIEPGKGLEADATSGKLKVKLEDIVDVSETSPFKIVDGKLTIKVVSADAGNNIKEGSDKGAYFPADLGTL